MDDFTCKHPVILAICIICGRKISLYEIWRLKLMMNRAKSPDFENVILVSNVNDFTLSSVIYFSKTLAPSTLLWLSYLDNSLNSKQNCVLNLSEIDLRVRTSLWFWKMKRSVFLFYFGSHVDGIVMATTYGGFCGKLKILSRPVQQWSWFSNIAKTEGSYSHNFPLMHQCLANIN